MEPLSIVEKVEYILRKLCLTHTSAILSTPPNSTLSLLDHLAAQPLSGLDTKTLTPLDSSNIMPRNTLDPLGSSSTMPIRPLGTHPSRLLSSLGIQQLSHPILDHLIAQPS